MRSNMKKGNEYLESLRCKSLAANRPRRSTRAASPPPVPSKLSPLVFLGL